MKYEKSCGAVIFRKTHGKYAVLLIKNRFAEFWSFPKGHVEEGENEYQTAEYLNTLSEKEISDMTFFLGGYL